MAPDKPRKIAIVGGGIGGLYAALSVCYHTKGTGVQIDVYEQASEFKEIGAGVGLGPNAAKLIHDIGLGEQLNSISGDRNGIWIDFRRYDNDDCIIAVEMNDTKKIRQSPVSRSDILDLFRSEIEKQNAANLHVKKKFSKVEDNGDHVTIHFADSTTATADLLIGCDGIHSGVRNQFGDNVTEYSGQIAYRATIPTSQLQWWPHQSHSVCWCAKNKHFLTFPISCNKTLNVVAFADASGKDAEKVAESWVSTCDRSEVERDYKDFAEPVQRIIKLMPEQPSKWRINDRRPLDQWSYMGSKVILLGDAAHAMLPHMGAGAGQAIEDGWILGRALGELLHGTDPEHLSTLQQCAELYQKVRLPRAQKVQATSRIQGATYDLHYAQMGKLSFEDSVPVLRDMMKDRMKFVWEVELDQVYEDAKKAGGIANGVNGSH